MHCKGAGQREGVSFWLAAADVRGGVERGHVAVVRAAGTIATVVLVVLAARTRARREPNGVVEAFLKLGRRRAGVRACMR